MHLGSLKLRQFRNIEELSLDLTTGVTFITGKNAQGKTNILEAVDLLSRGSSFRAKDYDLVMKGRNFYKVEGTVVSEDKSYELAVTFKLDQKQKEIRVSKDKAPIRDLSGIFPTVRFSPTDMNLVFEEPSKRRALLDELLLALSAEYREALAKYKKALSQRSNVLWKIKEGRSQVSDLDIWDVALAKYGSFIIDSRFKVIEEMQSILLTKYKEMSGGVSDLSLRYLTSLSEKAGTIRYQEELIRVRERDVRDLTTSVGPHRDDLLVLLDGLPMSTRASRGEVRTAMVALKSGELELLHGKLGARPALLLDDVFSELDRGRQETLSEVINSQQTIITTTEERPKLSKHSGEIYEIERGVLSGVLS